MIEFGGENKEINNKSKTAPFLLSLRDTPDNELHIVIAFQMEGEEGADLDNFPEPYKSKVEDMLDLCQYFRHKKLNNSLCMKHTERITF